MNQRIRKKNRNNWNRKRKSTALYLSIQDRDKIKSLIETRNFFEGRAETVSDEYLDKLVEIINKKMDRGTYEQDIEVILEYKNNQRNEVVEKWRRT